MAGEELDKVDSDLKFPRLELLLRPKTEYDQKGKAAETAQREAGRPALKEISAEPSPDEPVKFQNQQKSKAVTANSDSFIDFF